MKFNKTQTVSERLQARPDATVNKAGGLAFMADPRTELYLRACASFLEDSYYTKAPQKLAELRTAISKCDRGFVLRLAAYARNEMHLRTLPLVLLAEASVMQSSPKECKSDVRRFVPAIVRRADEPAELLAYWISQLGKGNKAKLPNALKRGLSDAFERFDEYQLAKYNRDGAVKLRDVLNLIHAKPTSPERAALYKRVLEGQLATPETWEVALSTQGASAETWNAIAPKMGIMAILRNLRNFEKHGATEAIKIALEMLQDPEAVRTSKLLPFRWFSAEREIRDQRLKDAVQTALNLSIENVPTWSGSTAIFVDLSGSMETPLSAKSKVQYVEVGALMGAMATKLAGGGEYLVGAFGASYADVPVSKHDGILTNMRRIRNTGVGHSTNAWLTIESLRKRKKVVDRVILFSDMQCYDNSGYLHDRLTNDCSLASQWKRYQAEVNPKAILYSVNLAGEGTLQFPSDERRVVQIAGWSGRILDLISSYEAGGSVVEAIAAAGPRGTSV